MTATATTSLADLFLQGEAALASKKALAEKGERQARERNEAESSKRWDAMVQWFEDELGGLPGAAELWEFSNAHCAGGQPDDFCLRDGIVEDSFTLEIALPGCSAVTAKIQFRHGQKWGASERERGDRWYQENGRGDTRVWRVPQNWIRENGNRVEGDDYATLSTAYLDPLLCDNLPEAVVLARQEYARRNELLAECAQKNAEYQQRQEQRRQAATKQLTLEERLVAVLREFVRDLIPEQE